MWLTGSRAAVAAFLLASMGLLVTLRPSRARKFAIGAGVAACAAAAIAFVILFPNRASGSGISLGWLTRIEMAKVSWRMITDHPWFGVGAGRFYELSANYLPSTRLADVYSQENAHNNYLQVLAELGIVGAVLLLWLAAAAGRYAVRGLRNGGAARIALLAGLAAFAATMLLGHPLLTPEVCYVFALAAGVATGGGIETGWSRTPTWMSWGAAAAVLALAASVPPRVHIARASADMEQVAWGTGPWQTGPDGVKARAMRTQTTLFVSTRAAVIEIPVRLDRPGPRVVLSVTYRDHGADDLVVASTSWSRYRLIVGGSKPERRYEPIVLAPKSGDATNVRLGKIVEY